ncbi:MAG: hypothetical protein AUH81_06710 [Candidatus Rokubacteria bacterium 13_1_40CM_4_69_5]|nr:MAG: hypothetical protein AUH81_06710 [Candidatus Rokubacteria bacterium 13_1_40CM_4_69_5]
MVLASAGCNALRDAFSAHPQVAGTAGGQTLTVTRLADLAGRAKKVPLRPEALTGLTTIYLDYAVFAVELARGRNMADSALVLQANWPNVAQVRWEHYHDQLVTARSSLTGGQTDSAYQAGDVRLFQHILISVPPGSAPKVERDKKQRAEGLLRQAATRHGANFVQVARRYSEDPGSKSRGGYLGTVGRGRFVPAFDSVAWQLAPGGMSGVVRSPFGFHIIRRPPLEEARDSFRADLETAMAARFDSAYVESLATQRNLKVESGAAALVRQTIQDIAAAVDDTRKLATYRGGTFRVRELARWLYAIDPRDMNGIAAANDAQLTDFVRHLAQRELLLREVDSAGVRLTPDDWRGLRTQHDSALKILENLLAISPQLFKDSAATEPARIELAMRRVNDYLDHVFDQGAAQFFPVPPFLAMVLRAGQHWSVNGAGVSEALERAQAVRAQLDSATRRSGTGLKPAPGPAPAPPADSAKRKAAP